MRHRVAGKKLNRTASQRTALRRNLVTDLLRYDRIRTTRAKAEAIQGQAEKAITLAKLGLVAEKGDPAKGVHARRQALSFITREDVAKKLFDEIAPKYAERNGGYTRITRIGVRRGDAAETAVIELV